METGQKKMVLLKFSFSSAMILNTEFEHKGMNMAAVNGARNELRRSCVQICVQSKRKSSYETNRNCLIFKEWSHLGLNQGLPDYESGALTN